MTADEPTWPAGQPNRTAIPVSPGADVRAGLRAADERLRAMLLTYEERPGEIDEALGAAAAGPGIERTLTGIFRLLQEQVYADDSPLRLDDQDAWEAFRWQREEFLGFYASALAAVETYREVLQAHPVVLRKLRPGSLKRLRSDVHVLIGERTACVAAFREFQAKFSSMLTVLAPVPRMLSFGTNAAISGGS